METKQNRLQEILDRIIGDDIDKFNAEIQKFIEYKDKAKKLNNESNNDNFRSVFTGEGVASIRGTLSGVKVEIKKTGEINEETGEKKEYQTFTNESYSEAIKNKWESIKKELDEIQKIFAENNNELKLATAYEDLCKCFPTATPNNITNRFLSTYFYDQLTVIASFNELKNVLEFIGIEFNANNAFDWLPLNRLLNKSISDALKNIGAYNSWNTDNKAMIVPLLGWKLVEYMYYGEDIKELLEKNYNIILTGAPGTGKTYLAKKIAEKITGDSNTVGFVQFHPSFDYTDFVEGLRPKQNGSDVGFELKDGIFKKFCAKAGKELFDIYNTKLEKLKNTNKQATADNKKEAYNLAIKESKKYVFIIDEINRGEISKIFGELFFSIDPGYRGKSGAVRTQYANMVKDCNEFDKALNQTNVFGHFFVPDNVYIIGTMNDIDRSVESMDFAFRRRFAFYEVKATDKMLNSLELNPQHLEQLKRKMNAVNNAIVKQGLTEAYQIGGSYFLKIEKYYKKNSDEKSFKYALEHLWNYHLRGTIYEYFRGEPDVEKKLQFIKDEYDR